MTATRGDRSAAASQTPPAGTAPQLDSIPSGGGSRAEADLRRRISVLEAERWRTFEDAQREADRVFAQYQLSQLLASGDTLTTMAEAVLEELLRHNGAARAALWLAPPGRDDLDLVAAVDEGDDIAEAPAAAVDLPPRHFDAAPDAARWSEASGWSGVTLEESRDLGEKGVDQQGVGFVALAEGRRGPLEPDHERFLALIRHELAIAFRAAQLREILARERSVLSAILDGASEAIVAVDTDRRVVRANVAALTLLGTSAITPGTRCEDVLGCRAPSSSPGSSPDGEAGAAGGGTEKPASTLRCGSRCPFEEVLHGGAPVVYRERTVAGAAAGAGAGADIPIAGSYALMSGTNAGAVAVLRDLRAGRAIDELKASFVAAVSHELRTPLALIGGYTETLLHLDLEPDEQREYVEKIRRASQRLAGLVDEILEISRIESDRLTLDRRPTALADIVAALANDLAESPDPPRLSVRIADGLPLLDADPVRVAQILGNLVSNAGKYAGTEGEIRLVARRDGDVAVITVQDDGPGIDPDEREHVFEQFYRGRRVRSTSQPGSGLGLYLCQRLVEAHGGRIWLDDGTKGTSISLTLPFVAPRLRRTPRP